MYFDSVTLAAVADELREHLVGGRIQRVRQTGALSIGMEIYAHRVRHQLLASAHPRYARVHLVQGKLSRGVEQAGPLLLLLRKYVLGGRIIAIEQPALERILMLSIVKEPVPRNRKPAMLSDEPSVNDDDDDVLLDEAAFDDEAGVHHTMSDPTTEFLRCDLIFEPMDRRSNIILVDDDNRILDSIKRVTPNMSRRVILPRRIYEVPPPQDRYDPRRATAETFAALRQGRSGDLVKAMVGAFRGLSPQLAREVVFRALGRVTATIDEPLPWYTLAAQLRSIFSDDWEPTLAFEDGEPTAFAPYRISHLPNLEPQPAMSTALERFYAGREQLTANTQQREALQQQLAAALERLQHQQRQIEAELERARDLERLRWEGEMIFGFMHSVEAGQTELEVEGRRIKLDPERNLIEQAQERFKAYEKARSAVAGLPERLQEVAARIDGLEQLITLLELSNDFQQIEELAREAEDQGYLRPSGASSGKKRKPARVRPLRLRSSDGFDIYVGRSSGQNDEVTFRIARPEDVWLHARGIHGAHVIVRSGGHEVPEQTLREAAGLAAYFSRARNEAAVDIDMARRSRVRRVPGGPVGLATYVAEATLRVAPHEPWEG
jgi:predicted ribosome quality control (RQC) complex YloA/Tae2 family protein